MMQEGFPVIRAIGLGFSAGKQSILRGIDFSIARNDFVLIFGPNGAGKSTLLKVLAGLVPFRHGEVLLDGSGIASYSRMELASRLSYLPQSDEFGLPIRVQDILLAGRYPYRSFLKRLTAHDREIFSQGVEQFGLGGLLQRNMQTLSGGERKKVLLASAFIQDVPLILLDEPLNFLDPGSTVHLTRMLQQLHRNGKTILVVSHEIERFFPYASQILALKDGEARYFGPKVFSPDLFREVYQVSYQRTLAGEREIIFIDE